MEEWELWEMRKVLHYWNKMVDLPLKSYYIDRCVKLNNVSLIRIFKCPFIDWSDYCLF